MKNRIFLTVLIFCIFLTSCSTPAPTVSSHAMCDYDRARLLSLEESKFDEDLSGGWRTLASNPGCQAVAADLLRDYRQVHKNESGLLYWHEGQLRAFSGQTQEAIALMEHARPAPGAEDNGGWGPYVEATIAFLRRDKLALDNARLKLAALPPPTGKDASPVIDGFFEVDFGDGKMRKFRWPPNIDVVEGLIQCFDKSYTEAYADTCRVRSK